MTKNPKTIAAGMLASEIMRESVDSSRPAVSVLIVAEGKKPIGIVHVHDVAEGGRGVARCFAVVAILGVGTWRGGACFSLAPLAGRGAVLDRLGLR